MQVLTIDQDIWAGTLQEVTIRVTQWGLLVIPPPL